MSVISSGFIGELREDGAGDSEIGEPKVSGVWTFEVTGRCKVPSGFNPRTIHRESYRVEEYFTWIQQNHIN
jgi:hypothetical protein